MTTPVCFRMTALCGESTVPGTRARASVATPLPHYLISRGAEIWFLLAAMMEHTLVRRDPTRIATNFVCHYTMHVFAYGDWTSTVVL